MYFSRIDYQDLDQRRSERSAEMVWSPSRSLGGSSSLFTGVFVCGSYGPPHDLSWDVRQWDDPVMGDACLQGDNTQCVGAPRTLLLSYVVERALLLQVLGGQVC